MKKKRQLPISETKRAELEAAENKRAVDLTIKSMRDSGVQWIEWLCSGTGEDCSKCLKKDGKVMKLSAFKGYPKTCKHEHGCMAVIVAVAGPK